MKNLLMSSVLATISATSAMAGDAAEGEGVFNRWCLACHAEHPLAPATIYLSAKLGPDLGAIRANTDLEPDYIAYMVRNGQGSMPNFRRTEITNDELDSLLAYFQSLKEAKQ